MDYSHDQIFESALFAPFVMALQDAQLNGTGAIHQQMMTTIANKRWGIPAGVQFKLTYVRCSAL
jgi:hypothetical protein